MARYAPFLIMYTEYIKNFDVSMSTINSLYTANKKFAAIMDEIQVKTMLALLTDVNQYRLKLKMSLASSYQYKLGFKVPHL